MSFTPTYERIADKILEGNVGEIRRTCARFTDGKLHTGTCSLHRTRASRQWRMFWRLKANRKKAQCADNMSG